MIHVHANPTQSGHLIFNAFTILTPQVTEFSLHSVLCIQPALHCVEDTLSAAPATIESFFCVVTCLS